MGVGGRQHPLRVLLLLAGARVHNYTAPRLHFREHHFICRGLSNCAGFKAQYPPTLLTRQNHRDYKLPALPASQRLEFVAAPTPG